MPITYHMSASKMRAAASSNDLASFRRGLQSGVDANAIMKQVRQGMNLAQYTGETKKLWHLKTLNTNKLEICILEK